MEICNETACTGCLACMNSCPKDAITLGFGKDSQIMPKINSKKCVECGICQKICPQNTKLPLQSAKISYAAWSKQDTLSSSGGAAAVMSRNILRKGGTVYGVAVLDRVARHVRVAKEENLPLLRGSKYVQSEIGLTYRQAKEDLQNGLYVLFIGTPCQIAGLKAYLKKDYDKLYTVDLICHGTPPHSYLTEHLDEQTKKNWDSYSFRGEYEYSLTAYSKGKIVYQRYFCYDLYFQAFLKSLTYRNNCYRCEYARPERVADITIGDFWGLHRETLQTPYDGRISVILPNTEKGQAFVDECKGDMVCEERTFEEAANEKNENLLHPSTPHPERESFLLQKRKHRFDRAMRKIPMGKALQDYFLPSLPIRIALKIKRMTIDKRKRK